jgi:hypothetical protein
VLGAKKRYDGFSGGGGYLYLGALAFGGALLRDA